AADRSISCRAGGWMWGLRIAALTAHISLAHEARLTAAAPAGPAADSPRASTKQTSQRRLCIRTPRPDVIRNPAPSGTHPRPRTATAYLDRRRPATNEGRIECNGPASFLLHPSQVCYKLARTSTIILFGDGP